MKRIFLRFVVLIVVLIALTALWFWRGHDLTTSIDRFKTVETKSAPIKSIVYEGSGTGGVLRVDGLDLSLNEVELGGEQPNFGTSKDGELALSFAGKVFSFGPVQTEGLATSPPVNDVAIFSIQHSVLPWPNFLEINWMTGNSPRWKRNIYLKLVWEKPAGAKLEMIWRYEQFFYPNDRWTDAFMSDPGSTGLIRVEISSANR